MNISTNNDFKTVTQQPQLESFNIEKQKKTKIKSDSHKNVSLKKKKLLQKTKKSETVLNTKIEIL